MHVNAILPGPIRRAHQFYQLPHHPLKQTQTNSANPRRMIYMAMTTNIYLIKVFAVGNKKD